MWKLLLNAGFWQTISALLQRTRRSIVPALVITPRQRCPCLQVTIEFFVGKNLRQFSTHSAHSIFDDHTSSHAPGPLRAFGRTALLTARRNGN